MNLFKFRDKFAKLIIISLLSRYCQDGIASTQECKVWEFSFSISHVIADFFSEQVCEVAEHNGFLKNVCKRRDTVVYKCVHSDVFYSYLAVDRKGYTTETLWTYDKICDEDPNFYQMCGFANQQLTKRGVQHSGLESTLCNDLLCQSKSKRGTLWKAAIVTMLGLTRVGNI